jgi:hypothetical protein
MGGTTVLDQVGDFTYAYGTDGISNCTVTLYSVGPDDLPANLSALFGMPQIAKTRISVDTLLLDNGCPLYQCARPHSNPIAHFAHHVPKSKLDRSSPTATKSDPANAKAAPSLRTDKSTHAFPLVSTLLALFMASVAWYWTPHFTPTEALLSATPGNFPLFAEPPYASYSDLVFGGPPESPTPRPQPFVTVPHPPFEDPGSSDEVSPTVDICYNFMQITSSSFTGGEALRAIVMVVPDGHSVPISVVMGVDTLSDVTMALRSLLSNVHPVVPDDVRTSAGSSVFMEEGTLDIQVDGEIQRVPALVADQLQLPLNCSALLGVPAIKDLGIHIDEQLKEQNSPLICHLGEKSLRRWWDHHAGESIESKPFDIANVDIYVDLPDAIHDRINAALHKFHVVFEGTENTLPKPFNADPIELKFIPNAVPQFVPEPRWSNAHGNVVRKWAEDGLKNLSLRFSKSSWASRPHIVVKPPSGKTAATAPIEDCKLRVCGDYRQVNSQIEKMAPNLPTGTVELEKAAGHTFYFESDSVAGYNSFRLAVGRSCEALAVWTPLGLVEPTVLPYGQKNSGTEAQGPHRIASRHLRQTSNYVDGWLGYSNDLDDLCERFEEFLQAGLDNNIR